MEITEIIPEQSSEEYHSAGTDIISSSFIKKVAKYGLHFATTDTFKASKALEVGTVFHTMMEDQQDVTEICFVWDDHDLIEELHSPPHNYVAPKRTNIYREKYAEVQEKHQDKIILRRDEFDILEMMQASAESDPYYKKLNNLEYRDEVSIYANNNGVAYRIRPDRLYYEGDEHFAILDYKTCDNVDTFVDDVYKWRYDIQATFYSLVAGIDPESFYFLAVEKTPPYRARMFALSPAAISYANNRMYETMAEIEGWKRGVPVEPEPHKPLHFI